MEEEFRVETESQRARLTLWEWRAKAGLMAHETEAKAGTQKTAAEPEQLRTKEVLEGWRDEAKCEEWNHVAMESR